MENDSVTITQMEARVKDDYESDNETFPFYQEGELDVILSSLDQELDLDLEMSTRRRPSATSDREAFKRPCIEPEGVSRQGESNTNGYELKYEPTEVSATSSHEPGEEFDESMAMDEDGMFVKFQMMADEITRRITEFDNEIDRQVDRAKEEFRDQLTELYAEFADSCGSTMSVNEDVAENNAAMLRCYEEKKSICEERRSYLESIGGSSII